MGAENRIEDLGEEGNRKLGKMLQGPVRDTVQAWSLPELETSDGFMYIVRIGELGFAGRGLEVRPQRHDNHLNNCWDRRIGQQLKLSLQTVVKGFTARESDSHRTNIEGRD